MTVPEIAVLIVFCSLASVTQSVSGFGFGVVLVAVLPLFNDGGSFSFDIERVVVLVTLVVGINILIGLWRVRRHVSLRRVMWLVIGVPFGIPVGMYLLTEGPEWALRGLLGAVLVFAAIEPVFLRRAEPSPEKRGWALFAGVCSGALGGALSTGGPPVVIYYFRRQWSKEVTKAAVMLVFTGTVAMRLVAYGLKGGLITQARLLDAAVAAPVVVAASLVGERLFRAISQGGFRRVVAAMIVLSGAYQVYKAVLLAMAG